MVLIKRDIKGIYSGVPVFYRQGPCATGYHVPTKKEFDDLYSAGNSMGVWSSSSMVNFSTYLNLPMAGNLEYSDGVLAYEGTGGYYHTSTPGNNNYSYYFSFGASSKFSSSTYKTYGDSIRPFKDEPVVPDSGWTTVYQGTGDAGIFHNTSLGLISISSDGTTWCTIADKNLGATVVYNYGDALSESNCGKFYQRGNNYGFPHTGATTTGSSTVDASGYGYGNYYSNSTFILGSVWDSSHNKDLRGGGNYRIAKFVAIGNMKVWPTVEFIPGANTVAYFPLKTDQDDVMNNAEIPITGTSESIGYEFTGGGDSTSISNKTGWTKNISTVRFASFWIKPESKTSGVVAKFLQVPVGNVSYNRGHSAPSAAEKFAAFNGSQWFLSDAYSFTAGKWYHVAMGNDGTQTVAYVNGVNVWEQNMIPHTDLAYFANNITATFSDIIFEDNVWSGQEIVAYYNRTKDIYVQPVTEVGIYWSSDLGVISFQTSAGSGISIADKDLGATTVLGQGNGYQWGNNHPREYGVNPTSTSSTLVNASAYGPGNYYNSSTFIICSEYWDSSINNNLWGGTTDTYAARRGPCAEGWHIPSLADFTTLVNAISSITGSVDGTKITDYCKLKNMYCILGGTGEWATAGGWSGILSSDVIYYGSSYRQRLLYVYGNSYDATSEHFAKGNGGQYRAFSNTFIQPQSNWTKLN